MSIHESEIDQNWEEMENHFDTVLLRCGISKRPHLGEDSDFVTSSNLEAWIYVCLIHRAKVTMRRLATSASEKWDTPPDKHKDDLTNVPTSSWHVEMHSKAVEPRAQGSQPSRYQSEQTYIGGQFPRDMRLLWFVEKQPNTKVRSLWNPCPSPILYTWMPAAHLLFGSRHTKNGFFH